MKFNRLNAVAVIFVFAFLTTAFSFAQTVQDDTSVSAELRPFDFSDKFYDQNGIIAAGLVDRRNGADGQSVIDVPTETIYTNVRIIATRPAYNGYGGTIFWNYYAGLERKAFAETPNGDGAVTLAYAYPLYVFPSTTVKSSDRQAAMINVDDFYFEKNLVGVSAVMLVEYTENIKTKRGQMILASIAQQNGISLDGTPIIETAKDLELLQSEKLVTVRQSGSLDNRPAFAIAKAIKNPERGSITPDAFLDYVKTSDGNPLKDEQYFLEQFACAQSGASNCF